MKKTYETGPDGVLTEMAIEALRQKCGSDYLDGNDKGVSWDILLAQAQHQADVEKVRAITNPYQGTDYVVFPEGVPQKCAENCFETARWAILKALGTKEIEEETRTHEKDANP